MTTAAPPPRSPFGGGLRGVLFALAALYGAAALFEIGYELRHNGGIPPLLGLALLVGAGACAWLATRATASKRRRLFVFAVVFLALGVFQAGLWFIAMHAAVGLAAVLAWRASRTRESTGKEVAFVALAVGLTLLWIAMLAVAGLFALYSGTRRVSGRLDAATGRRSRALRAVRALVVVERLENAHSRAARQGGGRHLSQRNNGAAGRVAHPLRPRGCSTVAFHPRCHLEVHEEKARQPFVEPALRRPLAVPTDEIVALYTELMARASRRATSRANAKQGRARPASRRRPTKRR